MIELDTKTITDLSCTWKSEAECEDCNLRPYLNCRWEASKLAHFYKIISPLMLSFVILILIGISSSWIPMIVYVGFWLFFFGVFEIKVLCSHCPYYAENSSGKGNTKVLHCLANHGCPKIWKFNPKPLKNWEKLGFMGGAAFFAIYPAIAGIAEAISFKGTTIIPYYPIILAVLSVFIIAAAVFSYMKLKNDLCTKCVNFSCPFNEVPKAFVDDYLRKNTVMMEAWVSEGYELSN